MAEELLDCISFTVPADALDHFEAACSAVCRAVSFFHDEANHSWNIQGVKERGVFEAELASALAVAEMLTGVSPEIARSLVPVGGWLARADASFPEQKIGRRFMVRGTHLPDVKSPGRLTLILDAGLAFGTGEHHSTRGCLVAFERVARRWRGGRILDLGTGSGILGLAATKFLKRRVLASDVDARAVRVARANARLNQEGGLVRAIHADGWADPRIARAGPYSLVFANILARPLCAMAHQLAANLAPGGTAILAGLLTSQKNWVLSAHRRAGLRLEFCLTDGAWSILILRRYA